MPEDGRLVTSHNIGNLKTNSPLLSQRRCRMYDVVTVGEGMLRLSPPRYERIRRACERWTSIYADRKATWPATSPGWV